MTTNTYRQRVLTTPSLDHLVNSFFNSAIGDVISSPVARKNITSPATNVSTQDDKYILEIALPGFSKADIDIALEEEVLTVSDTREESADVDQPYRLREYNYTGFKKSFKLPEDIDPDQIAASFKNGVLVITLHKREEALPQPPKKISIK